MGTAKNRLFKFRWLLSLGVFMLVGPAVIAQELPPRPIKVEVQTLSSLNFGTFAYSNGIESITVDSNGSFSSTSGIQRLHFGATPSAAFFNVTANPGTIIRIQPQPVIILNGSNGGSLFLEIDSFSDGQTFISTTAPPNANVISVGGTLHLGKDGYPSPPGKYFGSFTLTFIHE